MGINISELSKKDKKYIWHPYTVWDENLFEFPIVKALNSYLFDENGNKYIDAISSWWVNIHGHCHPYIGKKIQEQFSELDHVVFANFTHPKAIELSERLLGRLPDNQEKIFFSDNGSTAIEVALKIAVLVNKSKQKHTFLAFNNSYHGDTFGAMSVSDRSIFTKDFSDMLFEVSHIPAPIKSNEELSLSLLEKEIREKNISAFIFEPLVMGAGGMIMYDPEILDKMIDVCHKNNVLCIADEVMTGFGRTGSFFATDVLKNKPDIYCLSKGLTGGILPMGITSVSADVFSEFKDKKEERTLWHGHSYTANPIACAAACASLDLFEMEETMNRVHEINSAFSNYSKNISSQKIIETRIIGAIIAFELKTNKSTSYVNEIKKPVTKYFFDRGIIVRPLGNVLYFMPPYCVDNKDVGLLFEVLESMFNSDCF